MNSSYKFDRTALSYERSPDEIHRAGLARLASVSATSRSPNDIFQAALQIIAELCHADRGFLCLRDPETDRLEVVSSLGLDRNSLQNLDLIEESETAYRRRKRVHIPDIEKEAVSREFRETARTYKIRAAYSVPLLTGAGECIGVINLYFPVPHEGSELEDFLMDASIRHIADTVERIDVLRILRKKNDVLGRELEAMRKLHDYCVQSVAARDFPTLLNETLRAAVSLTQAESGTLHMLDPDTNRWEVVASQGFAKGVFQNFYPVSCRDAAEAKRRVVIEDIRMDPELVLSLPVTCSGGYRSMQSTPVISGKGDLLAIVSTYYREEREPSELDLRMLDLYIQHAAGIIAQKNEARCRDMADQAPVSVWVTDPAGRVSFVNRGYRDYYGDQIGSDFNWMNLLHPHDLNTYLDTFSYAAQRHKEFHQRVRVRRYDGQWRWIESRGRPLVDASGRLTGFAGSSFDITEIYESHEALKLADKRKDEFLAILAHELRNPLAPIGHAMEILRSPMAAPEKQAEAREMVDRQIKQIARLVDDLMDVSRITRGKIDIRKACVRLSDVIENAIETVRPLLDAAGHDFHVTLAPQAPYVYADPARLTQVFANILNNAAKYTNPGGRIWLTIEKGDGIAIIRIKDDGIGIPTDKLEDIFNMFSQVENTLDRAQGGLGIGLTLVKNLLHLHGGEVDVYSEGEGKGSEFTVRIPLAEEARMAGVQKESADLPASSPSSRRRILVVDDNKDAARAMGWMMEMYGHDVHVAHDGKTALEIAALYKPEFVFLDIGMPDMDGYEICRKMNRMPELRDTVFVAQTGWGQKEHRIRSHEAGFDFHLVKPVDTRVLQAVLRGDDEFAA